MTSINEWTLQPVYANLSTLNVADLPPDVASKEVWLLSRLCADTTCTHTDRFSANQVQTVDRAVFEDTGGLLAGTICPRSAHSNSWQGAVWMTNYYHSVAENLASFHLKMCLYLQQCNASSTLQAQLFMMPLQQPYWSTSLNWTQVAPYMGALLPCFTAEDALHVGHPTFADKVRQHLRSWPAAVSTAEPSG